VSFRNAGTLTVVVPYSCDRKDATTVKYATIRIGHQPPSVPGWSAQVRPIVAGRASAVVSSGGHESSRRADRVVEVQAGHHPFLSDPQAVADIVTALPQARLRIELK